MNAKPTDPVEAEAKGPGLSPGALRAILLGALLVGVGLIGYFIWRGAQDDADAESWDTYYAIRQEQEPRQDPLYVDVHGAFTAQRDRYIKTLEAFLDQEAKDQGGTLEPEVRWRLAKTLADHVLAQRDLNDAAKRGAHYAKALEHMKKIRDDFPDFPLNWDMWKPAQFPSLTRKYIHWLEKNQAWEQAHLLSARAPESKQTVVIRTTAGDMHLRMYAKDAKTWVSGFIANARRGHYDGTSFFEKRVVGTGIDPQESAVRGGAAASRGRKAYDPVDHLAMAPEPAGGGLLPGPSRNMIPHGRGLLVAWHDGATEYDDPEQFMLVVQDSADFDYEYTPVGKLLDAQSLDTMDAIFERKTWRLDPAVKEDAGDARKVLDFFQVPIVITKVLVYDASDTLLTVGDAGAVDNRAAPDASEQKLGTLKRDAYKIPEPAAPEPVKDPDAPAENPEDKGDDGDGAGSGDKEPK